MTCFAIAVAVFLLSGFASLGIAALIAASQQPEPPPPPSRIDCRRRPSRGCGVSAAREAVDAIVLAVDSPLLDGLDASKRLDLADRDPWGGLTPDEAAALRMAGSDTVTARHIWDGLSSGEMAALRMAASLEEVRLLLPRVDARLQHLVVDAMTAIAEETVGWAS